MDKEEKKAKVKFYIICTELDNREHVLRVVPYCFSPFKDNGNQDFGNEITMVG